MNEFLRKMSNSIEKFPQMLLYNVLHISFYHVPKIQEQTIQFSLDLMSDTFEGKCSHYFERIGEFWLLF